jgi:hypothetical protein
MSEATARARQPIDLEEFERRLRGSAAGIPFERARIEPQTLSDFARLMGSAEADAARALAPADPYMPPNPYAPSPASQRNQPVDYAPVDYAPVDYAPVDYAPAGYAPSVSSPAPYEAYPAFETPTPPSDLAAVVDEYPDAGSRFAQERQPEAYWEGQQADALAGSSEKRSRTPAVLIGAAIAICVVGIGATLALRGAPSSSGEAPTIKAAAGPVKIQPEQPKVGAQPAQSASILDRNDSERIAASRVVNREEQPIDIREAARAARVEAATPAVANSPPAGAGLFPEPRKVKTVSVRPDGSIVNEPVAPVVRPPSMASAPAPVVRAPAAAPAPAATPAAIAPVRQIAAPAAPVAPKVTARATPPVPTIGDNAPRNLAPIVASATPSTAAPRGGGAGPFAVQLAAPGSVAEANAAIARLKQRHAAELGGSQLVSVRASVNGKDIYRVRVTGLSQDGANGLCNRLKAGGGSCFVARN